MVGFKNFFKRGFSRKRDVVQLEDEKQYIRVGSSGTEIFSGYFDEEYLIKLRGLRGAELYDEMRRSDGQIRMLLSTIKNPILSADWFIESVDDSEEETFIKDFIEHVLMNDIGSPDGSKYKTWGTFVEEALTCLDFGFSLFEIVHKIVSDHPKFGNYIGLRDLGWRSPKTIEEWNLNRDGTIRNVRQVVNGDLEVDSKMDGQFLMPITINKEGDNYEGISLLRFIYGNWLRKNLYRKLQGIGIEKSALGTPIGRIPTGRENSDEADLFQEVLERYTSHQAGYLMVSEGWDISELKPSFNAADVQATIDGENIEMTKSFLANFMELGLSGSGSFALGSDLSDIFLSGIQLYANKISEAINHRVIPTLINSKFGKRENYPKLKVSGINDKAGKEYAEILKILSDSGLIDTSDSRVKTFTHKHFGLPEYIEEEVNEQEVALSEDGIIVKASEIQSLVFDKNLFDRQQVVEWVIKHGFENTGIDETETSYRVRQKNPEMFSRFVSKKIREGVTAVIGFKTGESEEEEFLIEHTTLSESFQVPKGVKANAQRVLAWREKYGDEVKGMTQVGWTRASQLAKGGPVSFDTIKRISQFARHKKNATISPEFKGTPWKDAGYVAWLGWGGDEAILSWAPSIISQKENEKKASEITLTEQRSKTKKKVKNSIDSKSKIMEQYMVKSLTDMSEKYLIAVEKTLKNNSKSKARFKVVKEIKLPDMKAYKKGLEKIMLDTCIEATNQAIMETPVSKKDIKLGDYDDLYKELPKNVRDKIKTELELITNTQESDLEKVALFQFNSAIDTYEDANMIINDMRNAVVSFIDGNRLSVVAVNAVSDLTNTSRLELFQTKEVWDEVESFEFFNPDPKSPICKNLNGRVFRKDDPTTKQYLPPLHHNCKSIIIPQYKGVKGNKELHPLGLQPSGTEAELIAINKSKGF